MEQQGSRARQGSAQKVTPPRRGAEGCRVWDQIHAQLVRSLNYKTAQSLWANSHRVQRVFGTEFAGKIRVGEFYVQRQVGLALGGFGWWRCS